MNGVTMADRRIDDFGGMPKTSDELMKSKTHVKHFSSAEGAGHMKDYPDTTEEIKRDQEQGVSKIKKHPQKTGYRH